MRIAFLSSQLPPESLGGIGTYTRSVAAALGRCGHDVEIFTATRGHAHSARESGSLVHRVTCPTPAEFSRLVVPAFSARHRIAPFDVAEGPELFSETAGIRAACPDLPLVVRIHSPMHVAREFDARAFTLPGRWLHFTRFLLGSLLRLQSPGPSMRFGRDEIWRRPPRVSEQDPERLNALAADLIAVPSTPMYERLVRDWRLPVSRTELLPNLCPPDPALCAINRPPSGTQVLFIGRLVAFKGVFTLAAAIPRVLRSHSAAHFRFAGESGISPRTDFSLRAFLRGKVLTYDDTDPLLRQRLKPCGPHVSFSGRYEQQDLPQLLAHADICVLPSWWDNFPTACLEAMAAGRAIIGTRSGGMVDMLDGGRCGILVEPRDPPALARALVALLADPDRRVELGRLARERASAVYSEAALAVRYEQTFARARQLHAASSLLATSPGS